MEINAVFEKKGCAPYIYWPGEEPEGRESPISLDDPMCVQLAISRSNGYLSVKASDKEQYMPDNKSANIIEMLRGTGETQFSHITLHFVAESSMRGAYVCVHRLSGPRHLSICFIHSSGVKTTKKYRFIQPTEQGYEWHYLPIGLVDVVQCEIYGLDRWSGAATEYPVLAVKTTKKYRFIQPTEQGYEWHYLPIGLVDVVQCEIYGLDRWSGAATEYPVLAGLRFVKSDATPQVTPRRLDMTISSKDDLISSASMFHSQIYDTHSDVSVHLHSLSKSGRFTSSPSFSPSILHERTHNERNQSKDFPFDHESEGVVRGRICQDKFLDSETDKGSSYSLTRETPSEDSQDLQRSPASFRHSHRISCAVRSLVSPSLFPDSSDPSKAISHRSRRTCQSFVCPQKRDDRCDHGSIEEKIRTELSKQSKVVSHEIQRYEKEIAYLKDLVKAQQLQINTLEEKVSEQHEYILKIESVSRLKSVQK
ncbi:hypothetical protein ADUPG1_010606 [Aduncisulcus paluster]|uniref:Uncharacterized protein n=1 Tax=Aduncisulcus paluster TaxID=2918883 RepID=A0ABQ5JS47_9EUKA|nr:hypothetical protein ADUPG1_010606 [Aduncisulcus paluster]